jgi:hypothetical protein
MLKIRFMQNIAIKLTNKERKDILGVEIAG